jgi:hypothetical protein
MRKEKKGSITDQSESKEPNSSAPLPSSGRSMSVGIHAKRNTIYPPCKLKQRAILFPKNEPKTDRERAGERGNIHAHASQDF